jgi:RNA polymerase sigma-70 factor (ECF subfamily)
VGPDPNELTDLLLAAADGDRAALAAAIRGSQAEVWRMAAYLVGRDEADDVTQDVFVGAWRALPAFRGDASGRTWLLSIARNTCVDAQRARYRRRRLLKRVVSDTPAEAVAGPESALALRDLIARLPSDRRSAFVLTQVIGCSYEETAEICGVAVGTIRSRVARARGTLVDESGLDRSMETG